jgi:beta-mannosidase
MPRQIKDLSSGPWYFGRVPRRPFSKVNIYDLSAVTEWLPATVPGNVRTDLLALGRISQPFCGENFKESRWTEDEDWWYRRSMEVDTFPPRATRAFIIFEGIDYQYAIFINGQEFVREQGMFSRRIIEVTDALSNGRDRVELAVRLWGSSALPRRQLTWQQQMWQNLAGRLYRSWVGIYPDRSATLKCQMSFGWDFAPPIRTMGIWDDVRLVHTGPVFIEEASATATPKPFSPNLSGSVAAPGTHPSKATRQIDPNIPTAEAFSAARLSVHITLNSVQPGQTSAAVSLIPANFDGRTVGPYRFTLNTPIGKSVHCLELHLPRVALWQPWDRGYPHLYQLQISLTHSDGHILDETQLRTGICSIDLDQWQLIVNGRREFIRGLNWVPADSFPGRLREAQYETLLDLARKAGANLLRVWGGGLREKQPFYDLCDQIGLLVWQEFPFACMFLGDYPRDPTYLAQVRAECGAITRQLRHHPSIALWCGGNEFSHRRNRPLLDTLGSIVAEHDGTRPFVPVSPSFGPLRDSHNWQVWHGQAAIKTYQTETAHFLSEFGLQALPNIDTLTTALANPTDIRSWPDHLADLSKLARYSTLFLEQDPPASSPFSAKRLRQMCRARRDLEPQPPHALFTGQQASAALSSLISASQQAQAVALQTAIEHMRRRKGEAGGLCVWQFNEPWPAISWAIVDYFGRPKLAYSQLSSWYKPILISLKFPVGYRWRAGQTFAGEIWAINDSLVQYDDCQLRIELDGRIIHTQSFDLDPDSAYPIGDLTHFLPESPRKLRLFLVHQTATICHNSYDLGWSDTSVGSLHHRLRRWLAEWVLR